MSCGLVPPGYPITYLLAMEFGLPLPGCAKLGSTDKRQSSVGVMASAVQLACGCRSQALTTVQSLLRPGGRPDLSQLLSCQEFGSSEWDSLRSQCRSGMSEWVLRFVACYIISYMLVSMGSASASRIRAGQVGIRSKSTLQLTASSKPTLVPAVACGASGPATSRLPRYFQCHLGGCSVIIKYAPPSQRRLLMVSGPQ